MVELHERLLELCKESNFNKEYKDILKKIQDHLDSDKKEINEFFEKIWKEYPNKKGKGQISFTTKKKLFRLGYEKISNCIAEYKKDKDLKVNNGYKEYQNGSTFFSKGYVDYISLDEKDTPKQIYSISSTFKRKDL